MASRMLEEIRGNWCILEKAEQVWKHIYIIARKCNEPESTERFHIGGSTSAESCLKQQSSQQFDTSWGNPSGGIRVVNSSPLFLGHMLGTGPKPVMLHHFSAWVMDMFNADSVGGRQPLFKETVSSLTQPPEASSCVRLDFYHPSAFLSWASVMFLLGVSPGFSEELGLHRLWV